MSPHKEVDDLLLALASSGAQRTASQQTSSPETCRQAGVPSKILLRVRTVEISHRDVHLWGAFLVFSPQLHQSGKLTSQRTQTQVSIWSAWWIVPRFAPTRREIMQGFVFTEVSVIGLSKKQTSLTKRLLTKTCNKQQAGQFDACFTSQLLWQTVCKVNRMTRVYNQTVIFQSFSSLESTCTTQYVFISPIRWKMSDPNASPLNIKPKCQHLLQDNL